MSKMISNDPEIKQWHELAEVNARRILSECCDRELRVTPVSQRVVVGAALKAVHDDFTNQIKARDWEGEQS